MRSMLRCSSIDADPGCAVTVRYLYEVHRGLGRDQVFAEMVAGFEMGSADPRVVGINLVMPEDGLVEMRDFTLHMHMMDYLHKLYPKVRISLHAGELAPGLVPPDGLRFHIRTGEIDLKTKSNWAGKRRPNNDGPRTSPPRISPTTRG